MKEIEICNVAIALIGGTPISSLDSGQPQAVLCKTHFDISRKAVLESAAWPFAMKRAVLNQPTTPPWGGGHYFRLPDDCLRMHRVYDPSAATDEGGPKIIWKQEGQSLYVENFTVVNVMYIYNLTNVETMPSLFGQSLASYLSTRLAIPITENVTLLSNCMKQYAADVAEARSIFGRVGTTEVSRSDQLTSIRRL